MTNPEEKQLNKENTTKETKEAEGGDKELASSLSQKDIFRKIDQRKQKGQQEWDHKVLDIARVTRVTAGGKRFTFRAVVVAGNKNRKVGVGLGKSWDLQKAVEKGINRAKKDFIEVRLKGSTIPYDIKEKFNSAVVYLKPAAPGSGVKAGGSIRVIAKLSGIQDISAKLISRTNNKINTARATINALKRFAVKKQSSDSSK